MNRRPLTIPAAVLALVVVGSSGAVADRLITGADVKDGSLQYKDLSVTAQAKLRGNQGPAGPRGPAGPGAQSMYFSTGIGSKTLSLPDGTRVTAKCDAGGSAHGGSRTASLTVDSSKYLFLHGRVDVSADGDNAYLEANGAFRASYPKGEHAVDSSDLGPVTVGVSTSYYDGGPGPNPTPTAQEPTSAQFSLLGHAGGTSFTMDAWLYVDDKQQCQIMTQVIPSTDSGTVNPS